MKYELKEGILKSGKGGKGGVVKNRKQAIAIALSEAEKVETKLQQNLKNNSHKN